jgi:hypothetical protein
MTIREYLANIGSAFSRLINVLLGGELTESLSARIGKSSLMALPMPGWLREHFEEAARWPY